MKAHHPIMTTTAFHASDEQYKQYAARSIQKALSDGRLTQENVQYVKEFLSEVNIHNNLSAKRRFKLASNLMTALGFLPPAITDWSLGDVYEGFDALQHATKQKTSSRGRAGDKYSVNTRADLVRIMKRFTLWMIESGHLNLNPEKIQKIRVPGYVPKAGSAESCLDGDEVIRLINQPKSLRYRALISILYESGCRIHELAELRWGDVDWHVWGCTITTRGKTGRERRIPIIVYLEHFSKWRSEHPDPENPDAHVFLNLHNRPLKYQNVMKYIKRFAHEAGIADTFIIHMLRHTRITDVLRNGMSETLAKKIFWGNPTTDMIKVYAHLTDNDSRNEMARLAGVSIPGAEPDTTLQPIQCTNCTHVMPPGSRFCGRCGNGLTQEAIKDAEQAKVILLKRMDENPALAFHILNAPGQ